MPKIPNSGWKVEASWVICEHLIHSERLGEWPQPQLHSDCEPSIREPESGNVVNTSASTTKMATQGKQQQHHRATFESNHVHFVMHRVHLWLSSRRVLCMIAYAAVCIGDMYGLPISIHQHTVSLIHTLLLVACSCVYICSLCISTLCEVHVVVAVVQPAHNSTARNCTAFKLCVCCSFV
jgi:hypothetical protein